MYGITTAGEVWKPLSGRNLLLLLEKTFYCLQHIEFYKSVSFLVGLRLLVTRGSELHVLSYILHVVP